MTPSTAPLRQLRLAYGTNGLTDLRLDDALRLLADLGYDGVALTLDHMHLDPLAPGLAARTSQVACTLAELRLSVAVETGARYVLNPLRKHHPTLLESDPDARASRIALLRTAVRVGADLGATAVHCFSGVRPPGTPEDAAWRRLADSLSPVLDAATAAHLPLAVEPEPGHLLHDLSGFHRLRGALGDPDPHTLGLTLDIGHCQCLEPAPPADCVRAAAPWLRHVQIEDMRRGVHEHLPFGDGEIDFPPVLAALADVGYRGLVSVELPRHSHAGPELARTSLSFLHRSHPSRPSTTPPQTSPPAPLATDRTTPDRTAPDEAAPVRSAPKGTLPKGTPPEGPPPEGGEQPRC
ncbi:sugar phosphate isomerase/epimerase family protein [Streptomyces sp. MST-110588]|uniref:sugar phosphate isomerase/epimerase family protein n=1 Tax=Streptomyces sp. MST-110588 TaxID=2833628 RepID=UPI001F5D39D1|nr:sugar phosphate isomerase/epimerase family protein [Streptomyces sp. MST-110588]UNO42975.1 sugar phosphate isomerase/epimerase [Streptomyces sp. MST-110588]